MDYLYSFRQGWQSENLARYIISKFAFIAQPSNISDDIGSDFFCTTFEIVDKNRKDYLMPKSSFVMQIKSDKKIIELSSDKIGYIQKLEIPYFIGVIDKKDLKLSIYSGMYLDLIFALKGIPQKLFIKLNDEINKNTQPYKKTNDNEYELKFPKIIDISANEDPKEIVEKITNFTNNRLLIQKNIFSRHNNEFILNFGDNDTRIFAGIGSNATFRNNFFLRLAEVFYNMEWEYEHKEWMDENKPEDSIKIKEELDLYVELYKKLKIHYKRLPAELETVYERIKVL